MNHSIKKTSISLLACLVLITLLTLIFAQMVVFADSAGEVKKGACEVAGNCTTSPGDTVNRTIETVINLLSVIGGVVAIIFIIIAGLKYITSAGKQDSIASAKNTLIYAVIGLVIIALAQVIVRFVLTNTISPSPSVNTNNGQQQKKANTSCGRPIC